MDHRCCEQEVIRRLSRIERTVRLILYGEFHMSKELDDLTAEVSRVKTVDDSIIALVAGLAAQITAAGTDPAKLQALTDSLTQSDDAIAAAVTANTK